jgi:hypothetical protein
VARPRKLYICRTVVALLALDGLAMASNSFAGTILSTSHNQQYGWDDSLFILGTNPVEVSMDGAVPGVADATVQDLVGKGMESAAPITCCPSADTKFAGKAPLVFVASNATPTDHYRVAWRFSEPSAGKLIVAAMLSRDGQALTQAEGEMGWAAGTASAGQLQDLTALARQVEKKLTPFPDFWIGGSAGN